MQRHTHRTIIILLLFVAASLLAACGSPEHSKSKKISPALVENIEGSDLHQITLTERAAERLGVQTAAVDEMESNGSPQTVVPYSAVIYDVNGATWVYTQLKELTFVREAVTIAYIEDSYAFLTSGPDVGVNVVSVGAAELYGADLGIGK